jgi:hypothetical protein
LCRAGAGVGLLGEDPCPLKGPRDVHQAAEFRCERGVGDLVVGAVEMFAGEPLGSFWTVDGLGYGDRSGVGFVATPRLELDAGCGSSGVKRSGLPGAGGFALKRYEIAGAIFSDLAFRLDLDLRAHAVDREEHLFGGANGPVGTRFDRFMDVAGGCTGEADLIPAFGRGQGGERRGGHE